MSDIWNFTCELRRIRIPRTWVNKGKKEGRSFYDPALPLRVVLPSKSGAALPVDLPSLQGVPPQRVYLAL